MLATVLRERPKWRAAALWLLPWIKTQVRISSRSATGYTILSLRSLEISFKYSGFLGNVAHFSGSAWLSISIAFTHCSDGLLHILARCEAEEMPARRSHQHSKGFPSGGSTRNQLRYERSAEFFGKWLTGVPTYQHFNGTLGERDRIKANSGQGWPHPCTKGDIIRTNYCHLFWHLDPPIRQRPQQEQGILVVVGVDAGRRVCSSESRLHQRVGISEGERERQNVKAHSRHPSDNGPHAFQPLLKSIGVQLIGGLHQSQMPGARVPPGARGPGSPGV